MNKELHLMSYGELQELKGQIETLMALKTPALRVGQTVKIDHRRFTGVEGMITKVNRQKVKVELNGSIYNVPKSMIII